MRLTRLGVGLGLGLGCVQGECEDETDKDCGGSCRPCTAGLRCLEDADCRSAACDDGVCAAHELPEYCSDGTMTEDETDVDCGGNCRPCKAGLGCMVGTDCKSFKCESFVCVQGDRPEVPEWCTDSVKSEDETDIDCGGGSCPACKAGFECLVESDCKSHNCEEGL